MISRKYVQLCIEQRKVQGKQTRTAPWFGHGLNLGLYVGFLYMLGATRRYLDSPNDWQVIHEGVKGDPYAPLHM